MPLDVMSVLESLRFVLTHRFDHPTPSAMPNEDKRSEYHNGYDVDGVKDERVGNCDGLAHTEAAQNPADR